MAVSTPPSRRVYVFADESGNFDFSLNVGATRYFVLTTLTATDLAVGHSIRDLRHRMAWEGYKVPRGFHATEDPNPRRERVFDALDPVPFRIDVTVLEKRKAQPTIRPNDERFYKYAWFLHFKYVAPKIVTQHDELMVFAATIGTRAKQATFYAAVKDVVQQVAPTLHYQTAFWSAESEPCLQAADYCCWAVARKWEANDASWASRFALKIASEFNVFRFGKTYFY